MKNLSLVLLLFFLSGCATWDVPGDYTIVRSTPSGAQITKDGKVLGTTPAVVFIPRGRKYDVSLRLNDEEKHVPIKKRYKWGKSFGRNFVFLSGAFIGWIVDLANGSAWQAEREVDVSFEGQKSVVQKPKNKNEVTTVAIAPPHADHPNISDDIGPIVEKEIKDKFPHYKVLSYESTYTKFADLGSNFDDDPRPQDYPTLYGRLGIQKVVTSNVDTSNDKILVNAKVIDFLAPETNSTHDIDVESEKIEAVKEHGWIKRPQYYYWLPNAVFFDMGSSATQLTLNDVDTIKASSYYSDDMIGRISQVVSSISIRRVVIPSRRDEWRYRFRMVPTGSFSHAKETFPTAPVAIRNTIFARTHADIGWGPSFNYENQKWDLYFNFLPILTYDLVETSNATTDFSFSETGIGVAAELGFLYFFKNGWTLRFYSRSAGEPSELWGKLFTQVAGVNEEVTAASFVTSGFAIGYVIPNKDLPF